jgi:DNA-directed DNA polymerase III PolC
MSLPQLRVRTEFTFRHTFGPCARVARACADLGAPAAAIVDPDTWGHVRWLNACTKAGIKPMFGTEFSVKHHDGKSPVAWVLAEQDRVADFYKFSSAIRHDKASPLKLIGERRPGIVFAGAALDDSELFDYIDVNPASPLQRRRALALHKRTGKPLVVTSDNSYPKQSDYGAFMALAARERATPQWVLSEQELRAAMPELDDELWAAAVRWTHEAAERTANTLRKCPIIHFDGDLRALTLAGKAERIKLGHIDNWTDEYEQRMLRELDIIHEKKFESYFLVVSDLVQWAKQRMLVGPGRGSSAGSLVCYLLRITEVDPLVHHLLFERFIDLTRSDLPDIDIDFSDTKREQVFEYLAERYGKEHVARIGNVNTLKPRSVMAEVGKRMGIPPAETFPVINALIEYSSGDTRYGNGLADTLETTDAGRHFMSKYPAAKVMGDCEGHAWHTGVHAAGVIVSNEPVIEYCTVGADGVAHIDKPDVDVLGLLKIDALGLRTLGVIEDAGVVTGDQLYALKLNDPAAFDVLNKRNYAGVFQFEGQSQRSVSAQVNINSFDTIDHITAISRPGPLGSGAAAAYVRRADGREKVSYMHPTMEAYLDRTLGLVLYQEQVMRIVRELGGFSWEDTTTIRKGMSARKGEEYFNRLRDKFIAGCLANAITEERAAEIWNQIKTMGGWAMNASHTCAYSIIAYWCSWMKAHHSMAYAAACLRNAKDDLQVYEVLRELDRQGIGYVSFDIERSQVNWQVIDGQLVGGFLNLVGFGEAKAVEAVEHRRLGTMTDKLRKKIEKAEVRYELLYPLKTKYVDLYSNPENHGCRRGSRVLTVEEFPDEGEVLFVATLQSKERRDENEAVRLARRNGKRRTGQTLFADLWVLDDCGLPILARIERWDYEPLGRIAVERLEAEKDVLLIRGERIKGYPMVKIKKLRCLTNPQALES